MEGLASGGYGVSVFAVRRAALADVERSICSKNLLGAARFARPDRLARHLLFNLRALLLTPRRYLRALSPFVRLWSSQEPRAYVRVLYHFFAGIGFVPELRRLGVDRVHCHFTTGANMALAANLYAGIPFSFTAHASGDIYMKTVLLRLKIERADFVVPSCEYNARFLDSITGYLYSEKFFPVHSGIALSELADLAPAHDASLQPRQVSAMSARTTSAARDGAFRVVSVGTLVVMKGHDTLIQAIRQLRDRGRDVRCVIIGSGPEESTLKRLRSRLCLEEEVRLVGAKSLRDVYRELSLADAFALLSQTGPDGFRDGLPNAILEAMAMGLPVVSTWVSGIPELVLHQRTGFLVHERDAEGAADALRRLMDDRRLRQTMGEAARKRVVHHFGVDRLLRDMARLFHGC